MWKEKNRSDETQEETVSLLKGQLGLNNCTCCHHDTVTFGFVFVFSSEPSLGSGYANEIT